MCEYIGMDIVSTYLLYVFFHFCLALKALIRGEVQFASVTDIAMPRNPFSSVVIYHMLLMILIVFGRKHVLLHIPLL